MAVVVIHEFGHFITAKKLGMRVKEFAFGFPPRLFSFTKGETTYSFNAVPLGGYVSIDGENGSTTGSEGDNTKDPRIFSNKSKWAQAIVLFAGPFMNLLLAFVLLSISYMTAPISAHNGQLVVLSVEKNSPAEVAGLKESDILENFVNPDQFISFIQDSKTDTLALKIISTDNTEKTLTIKPNWDNGTHTKKIGVSLGMMTMQHLAFFPSIAQGFKDTLSITKETVKGFGGIIAKLFHGQSVKNSLSGPIGIAQQVGTASKFGFSYLLYFVAVISINLGVINLVPLPALDGGRLLFVGIEAVTRKKINSKIANTVNIVGFFLLIGLLIFVTILDILRLAH